MPNAGLLNPIRRSNRFFFDIWMRHRTIKTTDTETIMTSHHKNEGNYHSTSRGNEAPKLHRVTQQSSLLAAEVFAGEPCWTTH